MHRLSHESGNSMSLILHFSANRNRLKQHFFENRNHHKLHFPANRAKAPSDHRGSLRKTPRNRQRPVGLPHAGQRAVLQRRAYRHSVETPIAKSGTFARLFSRMRMHLPCDLVLSSWRTVPPAARDRRRHRGRPLAQAPTWSSPTAPRW